MALTSDMLKERIEKEIEGLLENPDWKMCHLDAMCKLCKIMEKVHEMENTTATAK